MAFALTGWDRMLFVDARSKGKQETPQRRLAIDQAYHRVGSVSARCTAFVVVVVGMRCENDLVIDRVVLQVVQPLPQHEICLAHRNHRVGRVDMDGCPRLAQTAIALCQGGSLMLAQTCNVVYANGRRQR